MFKPLVENQFRGPQFAELLKDELTDEEDNLTDILEARVYIIETIEIINYYSKLYSTEFDS